MTPKGSSPVRRGAVGKGPQGTSLAAYPTSEGGKAAHAMGKRSKRIPPWRSEAGFLWKGRKGTRDANRRHDPEHYPRPRQAPAPTGRRISTTVQPGPIPAIIRQAV